MNHCSTAARAACPRPSLSVPDACPALVRFVACVVIAACLPIMAAHAATPATLLGPDLREQAVTLQSIEQGVVRYFDADRVLRQARLDELVEIHFAPVADGRWAAPAGERWCDMVLTDGQRYRGRFVGVDEQQRLVVEHPRSGRFAASLEQLASLHFDADASIPSIEWVTPDASTPRVNEEVILRNQDRLEGFVNTITDTHLELESPSGSIITMPLERIASIRFAATSHAATGTALSAKGHLLLLRDRLRVAATDITLVGPALRVRLTDGRTHEWPLSAVASLAVRGPAGSRVRLLDLPMSVDRPAVVFGVPWPATRRGRGGHDDALHLHGPTLLRFELPPGAVRLTAMLQLDVPEDHPRRRWADMAVSIEQGDERLAALRIDADQPRVSCNVSVRSGPVYLRMDEADFGPVLDRLRLSQAWVLIVP
jgi:hypothetical protein